MASAGTQSKWWYLLIKQPEQKSDEEEGSAMAALMRSTYEEIETNSKLVRDAIESQIKQEKERNSSKVWRAVWKSGKEDESIEQIQTEHDEKTFEALI